MVDNGTRFNIRFQGIMASQEEFDANAYAGMAMKELLAYATSRLEAAGIDNARRNAEWLLCEASGWSRTDVYAYPERVLAPKAVRRFEKMVLRRLHHEPLQYILGYVDFYGLRLEVTSSVLIPRPETEQVVETALRLIMDRSDARVLDVGTGSGCIAIATKNERPDALVWACDVSEDALGVAKRNAEAHGLDLRFVRADVMEPGVGDSLPARLDLLVSNPPYVTEEERTSLSRDVRDFEPKIALFAGRDPLLVYRRIISLGKQVLSSGGWIVFETHSEFGTRVAAELMEAGFLSVDVRRDLAGLPRIVLGKKPEISPISPDR